ncbi:ubinuclein-1 isoform X1 [Nerophis lumbriciformis]|uniref:ubinuclein-1 isoform X1 n=2 Tax=Nerophis lumbriciformis TaxID=546530 RepID=UPI003BA966EF
MAQPRRVQLTSLTCQVHSADISAATQQRAPRVGKEVIVSGAGAGPSSEVDAGSTRLVVSLFEPDDRSFPEFSYAQLLENKKSHNKDEVQSRSTFEEEEQREKDQLADIARKMEEKYAVKRKQDRVQDLIDIGYGYDDEDSFIDNSEAYDEFVPASITTKFGGFYVNSGVLHFREASDTDDEKTPDTSKKRKLKERQDFSNPKKKRCLKVFEDKKDPNAKPSAASETVAGDEMMLMNKKKKKKVASTLSVTSMLKKFRREKEQERQKIERAHQQIAALPDTSVMPLCPADAGGGGGGGLGLTDPLLSLIGSTNEHAFLQAASTVDFDIDLDCLLDVGEEMSSPKSTTQSLAEAHPPTQPNMDDENQPACSFDAPPSRKMSQTLPLQCAPLPEGLPPLLKESIKKLMLVAKTSEGESKVKFFTPEVNAVLLDIECQCREHGGQLRSRVYTHLSSFLPCSRETLLKRVKKLKLAEDISNVEDPVQKLKDAIGRAMLEQIASFNQHCQEYEQVKTLRAAVEGNDVKLGHGNNEEKVAKRGGGPKKLFKWNEEIREGLCSVLKGKLNVFRSKPEGTQQLEDYLKAFLDIDIKPLWPKGWMQSRVLMSESRKLLGLQPLIPMRRLKSEKKQQLSITGAPYIGPFSVKVEPHDAHEVVETSSTSSVTMVEASNVSYVNIESDTEVIVLDSDSSSPPQTEERQLRVAPLNALTDQPLAPMQPLVPTQELLAAAVAKFRRSLQHWSISADNGSPPLPPPPPQCSPVNFPERGLCHVVLPQLLQNFMGPTRNVRPATQMGSDDVSV